MGFCICIILQNKKIFFTTKTTKSVLSIVEAVDLQNNEEVNPYYG